MRNHLDIVVGGDALRSDGSRSGEEMGNRLHPVLVDELPEAQKIRSENKDSLRDNDALLVELLLHDRMGEEESLVGGSATYLYDEATEINFSR